MSKYIRTKDSVYELSNKYSQTPEEVQIALMTGNYKQSDTIEELCDEFVSIDYTLKNKYYHFNSLEEINLIYDEVYGAIWTDKGLKYVAKMNEKGELELI